MTSLERLLREISGCSFRGDPDQRIEGITYDSRKVRPGYVFVAVKGHASDGHNFIKEAIEKGAVAVALESEEKMREIPEEIAALKVPSTREALSKMAARFYGLPFNEVNLIGITGTNGKTTTSYILESIFCAAGKRPGIIGTIEKRHSGESWEAPVTTPESLDLMMDLRKMADAGVTDVTIEVSSHALEQGRVRDCPFKVVIFTNFGRDHLDYHNSMDKYFEAKALLFRRKKGWSNSSSTRAVINADDPKGKELARMTDFPFLTYGLGNDCDVKAENLNITKTGLFARILSPYGERNISSSLIGRFNVYNILAASTAAMSMGIDLETIASGIARLGGVPGRLELVENKRSLAMVVDYAHTPEALNGALSSLRPLVEGKLITVFGCGGDRDRGKRPEMGHIAARFSDLLLITSDNPRTEDPDSIICHIEEGVRESGMIMLNSPLDRSSGERGYIIEPDRRRAIYRAVKMAGEKDLILIAGKGHEDYQIIGNEKKPFDDRKIAAEAAQEAH